MESAAAIGIDGRIVVAIEEERVSRCKHDGAFPLGAIGECLRASGLRLRDIGHVCISGRPTLALTPAERALVARGAHPLHALNRGHQGAQPMVGRWDQRFLVRRLLQRSFGSCAAPISLYAPHRCDAALAKSVGPNEDALCLIIDDSSSECPTIVACYENGRMRVLRRIDWPNSLGVYYSTMTAYLGFAAGDGEYKVMGLAGFGRPVFADVIRQHILQPQADGAYRLNRQMFGEDMTPQSKITPALAALLGPPRAADSPITEREKNIAASVQAVFEEAVLDLAWWSHRQKPNVRHLIITGGCALNARANGRVVASALFETVSVPPAPHAAGRAIGAICLGAQAHRPMGPQLFCRTAIWDIRSTSPRLKTHSHTWAYCSPINSKNQISSS
ncbi:MAG: hypothetical protein HC826_00235 [Rhodospirillales bacterium]|nr:hypothetical protein [Rhodospirillales bacterium]